MGLISVLWGVVAMIWMVFALIPVIGITNWLLIPFAAIGAIIAAIGIAMTSRGVGAISTREVRILQVLESEHVGVVRGRRLLEAAVRIFEQEGQTHELV